MVTPVTNNSPTFEPTGLDPENFATPEDFGAALTVLRERLGQSIRTVAKSAGIPPATIGGYCRGRHLPPVTQPQILDALLEALAVPTSERAGWRAALARVRKQPGRAPAAVAPYRGLQSYGSDGAVPYVGRETETTAVLNLIEGLAERDTGIRCVAVVGPSGSGKSSLLRAGLIPAAEAAGFTVVERTPFEPLDAPDGALVVIDHLEQLLSRESGTDLDTQAQIASIARLAASPGTVVVLGLRADFYARALSEPAMLPLLQHQFPVGPMSGDQLRTVVEVPAQLAGKPTDAAFVDLVLADIGAESASEAVVLPLLSHALLMTWERSGNRGLTRDAYREVGGISGAVSATAEAAYESLDAAGQNAARRLFESMIIRDPEGLLIRRSVDYADIESEAGLVDAAETFVAARILTASETSYTIAHESTLRTWPRLAGWLQEDLDTARVRRQIASATTTWIEHGRADHGLIRGGLLDAAVSLSSADRIALTASERDLIECSSQSEAAATQSRRRTLRRLRALAASSLALAVVAGMLVVVLAHARSTAVHARDEALSRQVAAQARLLAPTNPALASQLAVAAYQVFPTVEARSAVFESTGERMETRLLAPQGPMRAAVSPDGRLLATANADGKLRIYKRSKTAAPVLASTTRISGGQLYGLAWAPDGGSVAIGSATGRLALYGVDQPAKPHAIAVKELGANVGIENVHFSADGATLYGATGAPSVVRWTLHPAIGTPATVASSFGGSVNDVAIGPHGAIATASSDGQIHLFSPGRTRLKLRSTIDLGGPNVFSYAVAFSPDGRYLVEGAKDKEARVYDLLAATPRRVATLRGCTGWVGTVAFSPDGREVVAGATGGQVKVWRVGKWTPAYDIKAPSAVTSVAYSDAGSVLTIGTLSGTSLITAAGPTRPVTPDDSLWNFDTSPDGQSVFLGAGAATNSVPVVNYGNPNLPVVVGQYTGPVSAGKLDGSVSASPDGHWVASGTSSGAVTIWPQGKPRSSPFVLPIAKQLIESTRFSHDSKTLEAAADDGTLTLIDVAGATPKVVRRLTIKGYAFSGAFSPDDAIVAATGTNNKVTLFDRSTGSVIATLGGFTNYTYGVAFSPDGKHLAGAGADKRLLIWDVRDPAHPQRLATPGVGPTDTVYNVTWSSDSRRVLDASQDGSVWMWQIDGGGATALAHLGNLGASATFARWMPSGKILAVGFNGAVGTWSGSAEGAVKDICAQAGSPITADEWSLYVPGLRYRDPCRRSAL